MTKMYSKWIYVVLLDVTILTYGSPGRYHDFHNGDWNRQSPWGWNRRSNPWGWTGRWGSDDWSGRDWPRMTQRTIEDATTEAVPETRRPTPPQPITGIEIRLEEASPNNASAPILEPILADILLSKNQTELTFQSTLSSTGPEEETNNSDLTSAISIRTNASTQNIKPMEADSPLAKNETKLTFQSLFTTVPEDGARKINLTSGISNRANVSTPSLESTQADTKETFQFAVFTSGPEDEARIIDLTSAAISNGTNVSIPHLVPIQEDTSLAINETELTFQSAVFTSSPENENSKSDLMLNITNISNGTSVSAQNVEFIQADILLAKNESELAFQSAVFTTNTSDETSQIGLTSAVSNKINVSALNLMPIQANTALARNKTDLTIQSAVFTTGPSDETSKIDLTSAISNETNVSTSNLAPMQAHTLIAKNETDLKFQFAEFTTGPEDNTSKIDLTSAFSNGTNKFEHTTNRTVLFINDFKNGTISTATNKTVVFASDSKNETATKFETGDFIDSEAAIFPDDDKVWSQWHVVVYRKEAEWFEHICGGSLVKADMFISAAHCFWSPDSQELSEPENFLLAAGKAYSLWNDRRDKDAQYSLIKSITTSTSRRPCLQPDLAFVILTTPFRFSDYVKLVCINFDEDLEKLQLSKGNFGTMATWTEDLETPSRRLDWLSLPYVDVRVCSGDQIHITRHAGRICAGEVNDTIQSELDSGNGLVFYHNDIPYLRGVATINPEDRFCFRYNTRSYTNIGAGKVQANPIKDIFDKLSDSQCEEFYKNFTRRTEDQEEEIESPIFSAASIGSWPVPTLPDSSAPAFQWHVGVYSKAWMPYMQICGGSLVKRDVVISAAHCFWDDAAGPQPASQFAVAGGKLYRPWNDTQDTYAQHSNVSKIVLPIRFRGSATNFQDDIAILRLTSSFTYGPGVQAVCVDFDVQLDREQLQAGNIGTVVGWGLNKENGRPSQRLNYLELPLMDVGDCITASDASFLKYITSDKICAGDRFSGRALCRGDSGGGLIIMSVTSAPYLRAIASTAAANENLCNAFAIAAFTQIHAHRTFLKDNIPGIDKECALPEKVTDHVIGAESKDKVKDVVDGAERNKVQEKISVGTRFGGTGDAGEGAYVNNKHPNVPYNQFVCNCNCK